MRHPVFWSAVVFASLFVLAASREAAQEPSRLALASPSWIEVQGTAKGTLNTQYSYSASAGYCSPSPTWSWTAAGGLISGDATGSSITVSWPAAGNHSVTASNSGCPGVQGTAYVAIYSSGTAGDGALNARFTVSPAWPRVGETVTFDGSASTGTPITIRWTFGDGTSDTGAIVSHVYSQVGTFSVTLSLTKLGPGMNAASARRIVSVTGSGPNPEPANPVVQVFYATDRAVSTHSPLDYGSGRAALLSFGRFDVSVPRDHRLARIERPSIWRFELREDTNKHLVIVSRKAENEGEFYKEAAAAVNASRDKKAFVFIHGFNVAFEDAVYRTAQLAYDLQFTGAAFLYSWPSNAELADYIGDLNNNDWTVPHLKIFLESVASRTGARSVHLIAHSMGNRALSNALAQIASAQGNLPRPHFRQLVLTAPDIDVDTFKVLAKAMTSTADHITLYASANDKALRLSTALNGYPRAGDVSGNVVVISGVDTIDASALDTDLVGHSYYGDHRSVVADIFSLLSEAKPPGQRFGLEAIRTAAGTYWKFRP